MILTIRRLYKNQFVAEVRPEGKEERERIRSAYFLRKGL